jgi:hypothetical protein
MLLPADKLHPALKHAAYSATSLLPGEDSAAFEKLHQGLIAEFAPVGALEEDIVADMARLIWRKQNLATFRIATLARKHYDELYREKVPPINSFADEDGDSDEDRAEEEAREEAYRAADEQARQEIGESYELTDIGAPATIDGLMRELAIKERLDALITKHLKQLLMVRGVKSVSLSSSSATRQVPSVSPPQISGPQKAA